MTDIQDYINTFMGLRQLQNQNIQVAEQTRQNTLQGINTFMQLARQTAHPGELTALTERFSQLGYGSPEQLSSLLTNVTPTEEALRASQTQFGIRIAEGDQSGTASARSLAEDTANAALTGANRGQRTIAARQESALNAVPGATPFGEYLNRAFASQALGGQTPGQATIDALMLGLPTPELQQAAGIKAGTRLGAGENAQLQTQQANNRLGWAQLAEEGAYHAGLLGMDRMKMSLMMKKAQEKGVDPGDFVALINAKTQLLKTAQDAKNKNPSDPELNAIVGGLNAVNQRMKALGLPYEPMITDGADILKTPFQKMIDSWFRGATR